VKPSPICPDDFKPSRQRHEFHHNTFIAMPIQRSRGGCHNCKRRKRKCDETRPQCRACQSRGDSCGGYNLQLRWHSSKALSGHPSQATDCSVGNASDLSGLSPPESATTTSSHSSPGTVIHDTSSASDAEREAFGRCSYPHASSEDFLDV
jgi:hypothetical protein